MADQYDAVVIGSGPGGYVCGIRLAQLGLKTALVERESLGGVCLNWGCIPSKALIHAGNTREKVSKAGVMGIVTGLSEAPGVNVAQLRKWKEGIVKKLTSGIGTLLEKNGADIVRGDAQFVDGHTLKVTNNAGEITELKSKNFVIATGCSPAELPGLPFSDPMVWTAKGALELEEIPERLVVIGGGIIGLELGTAFAKLGSQVTVVELMPQLLTGTDRELARPVERKLKALGFKIHLETRTKALEKTEDGGQLIVETNSGELRIPCDRVLVGVGFSPNSKDLGLENAGVELSERGYIPKDEQCRTNVPHIYAIGDVTGPPFLAHRASKEGIVAATVLAGQAAALDYQALPAAIFTDPEIATVGLNESQAKEQGYELKIGRFPYAGLGKALASEVSEGFFKIIADAKTDIVLGVSIVGYQASNLIAEAATTIEMAGTLEDMAATIHAHPTFPEGLMEAAEDAMGHAIHVFRRKKKKKKKK
jgi:dihydrolipoamide dehydrogenase